MRLRGIDYGPIWAASGSRGFFGEGYWFHRFLPSLEGLTFVAKTVTLSNNPGNMELESTSWQPTERLPKCIKVDLRKGIAINAVGLSNFGIARALAKGAWQRRTEPFMLSFMPISRSAEDRLAETAAYLSHLRDALPSFRAPLALQVNLSCPNTGEDLRELEEEAADILRILTRLEIPLLPKFNVLTAPETVARLHERVPIDGVCVSNTIPYGLLKEKIDWERMFGAVSPLAGLGGGGLSGAPLLPLVREWVAHARRIGLSLPINAGGGILHPAHVRQLFKAGADSVSVASVIMLRPWRLPSIIREAERHRFL